MICPYCRNVFSPKKVIDTWTNKDGNVRRRRKCSQCKKHFRTVEMVIIEKVLTELTPRRYK